LSAPAKEITVKLNEYFEAAKGKSVYWNAVVLDPRIKLSLLSKEKEKREFKARFMADLEPFDKYSQEVTDQSEEEGDWFSTIYKKRKISNLASELKKYLAEDGDVDDPLMYWRNKQGIYPSLAAMAKTYLAVPSTSTPSERAFSSGRLLIHYTRSLLSSEKIQAFMCLNSWFKNEHIQ
jgi:hAT family C-terminal dimerisation region